jgi:hypothetical protein
MSSGAAPCCCRGRGGLLNPCVQRALIGWCLFVAVGPLDIWARFGGRLGGSRASLGVVGEALRLARAGRPGEPAAAIPGRRLAAAPADAHRGAAPARLQRLEAVAAGDWHRGLS